MGGNAIKKVPISRIPKKDYNIIRTEIFEKFKDIFLLDFLYDLPNKEDFGDIDILYQYKQTNNVQQIIKDICLPDEIVTNGLVTSFSYKYFDYFCQIDFIKTEDMSINKFYLSYGDTGSIIGRITSFNNIKYGHDGLWIILTGKILNTYDKSTFFRETHIYDKLLLTNSEIEICKFLKLDYDKWISGFNNCTELYEWIVQCNLYSYSVFENLKYDHRRRLTIRKFYSNFLEYIEKYHDYTKIHQNAEYIAIDYFHKNDFVLKVIEKHKILLKRHEKFNGNYFVDKNINYKDIGKCMKLIKNKINETQNFDEWLDNNEIKYIYNEYDTILNKFYYSNISK